MMMSLTVKAINPIMTPFIADTLAMNRVEMTTGINHDPIVNFLRILLSSAVFAYLYKQDGKLRGEMTSKSVRLMPIWMVGVIYVKKEDSFL